SSATQDVFSNVVVTSGTIGTNNNFGELAPSSLSGYVYVDANNDGIKQTSELGIPSVTVSLTGTDDLNNAVSLTTTTQTDGSYGFNNLRPGTYAITEAQPAGYPEGKDTIGSQGGSSATQDVFSNVVLTSGTTGVNNNFGETGLTITGTVFLDPGASGKLSPTDQGLGGVTVNLLNSNNVVIGTT